MNIRKIGKFYGRVDKACEAMNVYLIVVVIGLTFLDGSVWFASTVARNRSVVSKTLTVDNGDFPYGTYASYF